MIGFPANFPPDSQPNRTITRLQTMSSRRSARVRGREIDGADTIAQGGEAVGPAKPQVKRARLNAPQKVETETSSSENAASPDWMNRTLTSTKRAEWDAVMKTHFYLEKPSDIYDLFELALHLSPESPQDAFVEAAGIRLTGPFDLLARNCKSVNVARPVYLHGRFFLDPPEVVTVAEDVTSETCAHWGLYRDRPGQTPTYVVYSPDASVCSFEPVALTMFSVLTDRLQARNSKKDPVATEQDRHLGEYLRQLTTKTPSAVRSQRASESLASSLHGLGIVVPFDAKRDSGYRELPVVGEALRDLLTQIQSGDTAARKKLTNLITRATIANDECDFGTGLLLGLDLFTAGTTLQKESLQLLRVAYLMLGRKEFAKVASDLVKHRKDPLVAVKSLLPDDVNVDATTQSLQLP